MRLEIKNGYKLLLLGVRQQILKIISDIHII